MFFSFAFLLLPRASLAFTLLLPGLRGWQGETIRVHLNAADCPVAAEHLEAAIESAADLWNGVSSANLRIHYEGRTTATGSQAEPVIECGSGLVNGSHADTRVGADGSRIVAGHLLLNGDSGSPENIATLGDLGLRVVIAHEFGHLLGLGHNEDEASMLYGLYNKEHFALSRDDVDGVSFLYPRYEPEDGVMGCASLDGGKGGGGGLALLGLLGLLTLLVRAGGALRRAPSAFLLLACLLTSPAKAADRRVDAALEGLPARAQRAVADGDMVRAAVEMTPKPDDGTFRSIFPLVGFEPTYKFFLGGGYFRRTVENKVAVSEWSLVGLVSQAKAVKFEGRLDRVLTGKWRLILRNEIGSGFESNYGLGGDTRAEDRVDVDLWKQELDVFVPYQVTRRLRVGPWLEHRIRHNHGQDPAELARQVDPLPDKEATIFLGVKEELDYRDIAENPSLGWRQAIRVGVGTPYWGPAGTTFALVDAELQVFQYLYEKDLVLAHAISGGLIFGQAPFLSQFRLGGTDRLRGFYTNRFRGSKYYVEQTELRFPIWDLVSGATFFELGEVTETRFSRAQVSYGAGLRIGIPPDKVSKVRIDYAMSRDQQGVFVDFAHAF